MKLEQLDTEAREAQNHLSYFGLESETKYLCGNVSYYELDKVTNTFHKVCQRYQQSKWSTLSSTLSLYVPTSLVWSIIFHNRHVITKYYEVENFKMTVVKSVLFRVAIGTSWLQFLHVADPF